MEHVKHFTAQDMTAESLAQYPVLLVDFWALWCGPCRMISPIIESLAETYEGRATIAKLNIDDHPEAATLYRVASIPTLILFKNGVEQEKLIGARGEEALEDLIDQYLD